jgi:hypothetical protein
MLSGTANHRIEHGRRPLRRDAGLQARHEFKLSAAALLLVSMAQDIKPGVHADIYVERHAACESGELGGHHAVDRQRFPVQQDSFPDHLRIAAETPLPKPMTNHDSRPAARGIEGGAAQFRPHA